MEGKVAVKKRGLFFGRLARNDGGSKTAREKIKLADKERPDKDEEKSEDL
jgi:hypothetical protein